MNTLDKLLIFCGLIWLACAFAAAKTKNCTETLGAAVLMTVFIGFVYLAIHFHWR